MFLGSILVLDVVVLVCAFFISIFLSHRFIERLRRSHAAEWRRLDSPSMVVNSSIANGMKMLRFVFTRRYRSLSDPMLRRTGDALVAVTWIYMIAFVLLLALGTFAVS